MISRVTRRHGVERGAAFYQDALRYAQSLWISGKPAQAILQLDKAWMADLSDDAAVLRSLSAAVSGVGLDPSAASAGDLRLSGKSGAAFPAPRQPHERPAAGSPLVAGLALSACGGTGVACRGVSSGTGAKSPAKASGFQRFGTSRLPRWEAWVGRTKSKPPRCRLQEGCHKSNLRMQNFRNDPPRRGFKSRSNIIL